MNMGKCFRFGLSAGALMLGVVLASASVRAQTIQDAMAAYQRGDYGKAIELFRPLAERGDAYAQETLARIYLEGEGLAKNYQEAAKWERLAAQQGVATAQSVLGFMVRNRVRRSEGPSGSREVVSPRC